MSYQQILLFNLEYKNLIPRSYYMWGEGLAFVGHNMGILQI